MPSEVQVGVCKKCRLKDGCDYSSADKDQCDHSFLIREKERRCLLVKGHSGPCTWWQQPCVVILMGG